ncbi:hypothetical protein JKP88DRAFT_273628 [Tribonema minus]|uniref:Uncharacterized protein n=1 Tax=Tribonema minus TaxID=303371 RepID=A0A835Z063_9STRA|nr:hypothetical protein JKP88DRAFT_273628 [Tribonema minus]
MRWRLGVTSDRGITFAAPHPLTRPLGDKHLLAPEDFRTVIDVLRYATDHTSATHVSDFAKLVRSNVIREGPTAGWSTVYMRPWAMLMLSAWREGEETLMNAMKPFPGVLWLKMHNGFHSDCAFRAKEMLVFEADETMAVQLPAIVHAFLVEVKGRPRFLDLTSLPEAIDNFDKHAVGASPPRASFDLRAAAVKLEWGKVLHAAEKRLVAMKKGEGRFLDRERATVLYVVLDAAPPFAEAAEARGYTEVYPPGWLEVGVGAQGTLSRMVLDGDPRRTLTGVEVLASSANSARRTLKQYFGKNRFTIVETASYDLHEGPFDALLCEVVGVVASSEGIVEVVDDLRARGVLLPLCAVIPARVETWFAPVCLRAKDLKRGGLYVTERFASVKPISFDDTAPSRGRGLLERYDLGTGERLTANRTAFSIDRDCTLHGIGINSTEDFMCKTAGAATVARNEGADFMSLKVSGAGDRAILQSKRYVIAAVGCSRITTVVATLGAATGVRARAGAFDCTDDREDDARGDGFFVEVDDGAVYVVMRSSTNGTTGVDTRVAQADWNLDKLNGTGISRATLDTTLPNVYLIAQEASAGVGSTKIGVLVEGSVVYIHRFDPAVGVAPVRTSVLPVRFELESITGAAEVKVTSSSVNSSGRVPRGVRRSVGMRAAARDISIAATSNPMLSLRLGACRAFARMSALHMTCTTAAFYELILNGTIVGASWSTAPEGKLIEHDTQATDIVGGVCITSGYLSAGTTYTVELDECVPAFASDVAGVADVFTLNTVCLMSSGLVWASADVEELT